MCELRRDWGSRAGEGREEVTPGRPTRRLREGRRAQKCWTPSHLPRSPKHTAPPTSNHAHSGPRPHVPRPSAGADTAACPTRLPARRFAADSSPAAPSTGATGSKNSAPALPGPRELLLCGRVSWTANRAQSWAAGAVANRRRVGIGGVSGTQRGVSTLRTRRVRASL